MKIIIASSLVSVGLCAPLPFYGGFGGLGYGGMAGLGYGGMGGFGYGGMGGFGYGGMGRIGFGGMMGGFTGRGPFGDDYVTLQPALVPQLELEMLPVHHSLHGFYSKDSEEKPEAKIGTASISKEDVPSLPDNTSPTS